MKRIFILLALLTFALPNTLGAAAVSDGEEAPRLVVNITIPGLRYADLERYADGFGKGGFERILGGTVYPYAYYSFTPNTPSALATLTTGANPSVHGIVGEGWWNKTTGAYEGVVADEHYSTFNADSPESRVAGTHLAFETFGDRVVASLEGARSVSVAGDPSSAIILGGTNPSEVWWLDSLSGTWTTSTKYAVSLPKWVNNFNRSGYWRRQYTHPWVHSREELRYKNMTVTTIKPYGYKAPTSELKRRATPSEILRLGYTPTANDVVAQFAKEAIIYNRMGSDGKTDVLNVCFDAPKRIAERYGLDSREVEDMYYRLDEALAELLTFASAQAGGRMVVVLTTDGGLREVGEQTKFFNASQARFLINSFLSATYGKGEWVLGSQQGGLWLNHKLLFSKGMEVESVQRQVATFALQLRGVSHALVASAMMDGNPKEGLAQVVQEGFSPRHSADVTLVLMPDWVEVENDEAKPKVAAALPYAPYRRALVAISGVGYEQQEVVRQRVDVRSLVATLAEIVGVELPIGAEQAPFCEGRVSSLL